MTQTEWIVNGEVGISSKTMWAAINGAIHEKPHMGFKLDVPHDPDDFRRCKLFVDECAIAKVDFLVIKTVVPWFAPFIDNWDRLVELYNEELGSGKAPKLYKFIQDLEEQSRILDGWKKMGPGHWTREKDAD